MSNPVLINEGPQLPPSYAEATGNQLLITNNESNFEISKRLDSIENYLPAINADIRFIKNYSKYRTEVLARMNSKINVANRRRRNSPHYSVGEAIAIGAAMGAAEAVTDQALGCCFEAICHS